jgi:hypothetical protein
MRLSSEMYGQMVAITSSSVGEDQYSDVPVIH